MSSKINPIFLVLIIPLIIAVGAMMYVSKGKTSTSTANAFNYSRYIEAPTQLAGNEYSVVAEIDLKLADLENGKVVSVRDIDYSQVAFAIFIPTELYQNIYSRQRYDIRFKVANNGALIATSLRKF